MRSASPTVAPRRRARTFLPRLLTLVAICGFAPSAAAQILFVDRTVVHETGDPFIAGFVGETTEFPENGPLDGEFSGSTSGTYYPSARLSAEWNLIGGVPADLQSLGDPFLRSQSTLEIELDGVELENIGGTSVFSTVRYDFDSVLQAPVGFDAATILLEATIGINGSFVYVEPEGGPAGARGSANFTFGAAGVGEDVKGVFLSPDGGPVGAVGVTSLFSSGSQTAGGFRTTTLTAAGSFTLTVEVPVTPGATEQLQRLTFGHGMELAVLNQTGGAAQYFGDFRADFGGNTISLERVVSLTPGVEVVAVIPEPSMALLLGLGLIGLARGRDRAEASESSAL